MKIEIVSSEDGSHTLFLPDMNETYHSLHGALTESQYVFIEKGLSFVESKGLIRILEVGFGTGLNAILALQKAEESGFKVEFHTLEPFPLTEEIFEKLNYAEHLKAPFDSLYLALHRAEWGTPVEITENFTLVKHQKTLQDFASEKKFDVVFFDAFAPNKQPEVWELENIQECYNMLEESGALVTYCAQGQFKRNLKAAGFTVEALPGPPGKKEMTRGVK